MGWSLSGLVIDKHFKRDETTIIQFLGMEGAKRIGHISFDEACIKFFPDNTIAIGFFGSGTLIFSDTNLITNEELLLKASTNNNILCFYISDNNGTYCFDYYSNGEYRRRNWFSETDDEINETGEMGEPLEFENANVNPQERVFNAIETTLGQSFYQISEDEEMVQYQK